MLEIQMVIDSIRVSLISSQRVVILKDRESNRYLPIWIGPIEADSIALKLQDVSVERPLTHDLLRSVIDELGATVTRIVVSDLNNDIFYAKIVLQYNGSTMEVDSRVSDAIALAVRTNAPIFANGTVVDKAGVHMDEETGKPVVPDRAGGDARKVGEEELRSLSAFSDFIETLNLDDLGKPDAPSPEKT